MTYVLHRRLGEDIVMTRGHGELRLRLVAALRDSIFQRELLMSQAHFLTLFPEQEGIGCCSWRRRPDGRRVAAEIEDALERSRRRRHGHRERLAEFHRVENTYLSTFQTLGGLGLLLGTVGLATVLLRNVLERRRELALLGAVGYRRRHFLLMVMAENALLLAAGLMAGAVCAGLAIAPADRRAGRPGSADERRRAAAVRGVRDGSAILDDCDERRHSWTAARVAAIGIETDDASSGVPIRLDAVNW